MRSRFSTRSLKRFLLEQLPSRPLTARIFFDLPAIKYGRAVRDITLTFKNGEVTDYSAGKNEELLASMVEGRPVPVGGVTGGRCHA